MVDRYRIWIIPTLTFIIGAIFGGWYMYEIKKQEVMAIYGCWAVKGQVFNEPYPFDENATGSGRRLMMERKRNLKRR